MNKELKHYRKRILLAIGFGIFLGFVLAIPMTIIDHNSAVDQRYRICIITNELNSLVNEFSQESCEEELYLGLIDCEGILTQKYFDIFNPFNMEVMEDE